ncbi:MAG: hypothetical protein GX838_01655 [Clostridiaceae bacterium]|nr:hypothetical protein [Clostridiaceae bacterium]
MADLDFLDEIKETESEAVLRVEEAREKSQLKRQTARQEAVDKIDQAYLLAGKIRQERMEEAQARYQDLVAGASASGDLQSSGLSESLLNEAATALAERIITLLEHR